MMLLLGIIILCLSRSVLSDQQLKLVHVVFAHTLYAPIKVNENGTYLFPEKLDYKYFLESTDDMTNSAKMDMFNLGVFLRSKYDSFLGKIFHPDLIRMRTTEYPLSMISGLLVDAGLWPPDSLQVWEKKLNWQPVPTDYVAAERDTLLLGSLCPGFIKDEKLVETTEFSDKNQSFYSSISKLYGLKIDKPSDIALLKSVIDTVIDSGKILPAWTTDWYDKILDLTFLSYDQLAVTDRQKKLNGGTLLKKIIGDSLAHQENNRTSKKIMLYSAEERIIIGLLKNFNLWSPHDLIRVSALIFETYSDTLTNKYSLKMMFYSYNNDNNDNNNNNNNNSNNSNNNNNNSNNINIVPFNLENCDQYCPLDKFSDELKDVLPENATALCEGTPSISTIPIINSILLFILLSITMINIY